MISCFFFQHGNMEAASVFGAECVWWCWGLNTGLCVFQASAFPLTFVPAPGSFICFALLFLVGKCIFYGTVGSQKVNWAYWCPLFCCIFVLVLPSILDDVQSVLGWWQVSCDGNCNLLLLFTEYPVIWSPQAGCSLGSIVQCFNLKIPLTYLLCNSIRYSRGKKIVEFARLCRGVTGNRLGVSLAFVQCGSKWSYWSLQLAVEWTGEGHMEAIPWGGGAMSWVMKCKPVRCFFSCCQPAGNKWNSLGW